VTASSQSQQAEASVLNPAAGNLQMRILIELQVQSEMMRQAWGITEDLASMRRDIADSIT
jgi:hypothetical protein